MNPNLNSLWSADTPFGEVDLSWQGDFQLMLRFPEQIDQRLSNVLLGIESALEQCHSIEETAMGYCTLAIHLAVDLEIDLEIKDLATMEIALGELIGLIDNSLSKSLRDWDLDGQRQGSRTLRLPVCYGGDYGPDIESVADFTGLSVDEVIARHASGRYYVYMLGFSPGFPYMGGMDLSLKTPRLKVPRLQIAAGSVGIADNQTGIYPQQTPGGWQIIGRCPLPLFDTNRENPATINAGIYVEFVPIEASFYEELVANGGITWDLQ